MKSEEIDALLAGMTVFNYDHVEPGSELNAAVMLIMGELENQYAWAREDEEKDGARQRRADASEAAECGRYDEAQARWKGEEK